jgi:hypothetical protein
LSLHQQQHQQPQKFGQLQQACPQQWVQYPSPPYLPPQPPPPPPKMKQRCWQPEHQQHQQDTHQIHQQDMHHQQPEELQELAAAAELAAFTLPILSSSLLSAAPRVPSLISNPSNSSSSNFSPIEDLRLCSSRSSSTLPSSSNYSFSTVTNSNNSISGPLRSFSRSNSSSLSLPLRDYSRSNSGAMDGSDQGPPFITSSSESSSNSGYLLVPLGALEPALSRGDLAAASASVAAAAAVVTASQAEQLQGGPLPPGLLFHNM